MLKLRKGHSCRGSAKLSYDFETNPVRFIKRISESLISTLCQENVVLCSAAFYNFFTQSMLVCNPKVNLNNLIRLRHS